jgi:hypothetical protein
MPTAAYRADFPLGVKKAHADVYLMAEISTTPERALFRSALQRQHARAAGISTDTAIGYRPSTITKRVVRAGYFHRAAAGPFSPARRYVLLKGDVDGFKVAAIALHLTNGCTPRYRGRWWHEARCVAVHDEISWIRTHLVTRLHNDGWTVVVGGDLNRGRRVRWQGRHHWGERRIPVRSLMQLAVIPAAGVTATLTHTRWIGHNGHPLHTDHDIAATTVHLRRNA